MTLIRQTQLAPSFSGAPVPLDRPTRYGDGSVVRAKAKQRPELDSTDGPVTQADIARLLEKIAAIHADVVVLLNRVSQ